MSNKSKNQPSRRHGPEPEHTDDPTEHAAWVAERENQRAREQAIVARARSTQAPAMQAKAQRVFKGGNQSRG